MPVLTDLASAEVKRNVTTLYGVTTTRPTLFLSDGVTATYVVDVNIGEFDPTGTINQYYQQKRDGTLKTDDGLYEAGALTGLPKQQPEEWQLDDALPGHVDTTMHNVPIARNNIELQYADIGAPVVMSRKDANSAWQVTGFSIQMPGSHTLYPVDLGDMTIDTVIDLSITTRLLTLAEIGEMEPFGSIPFGASAIYKGSTLISVV